MDGPELLERWLAGWIASREMTLVPGPARKVLVRDAHREVEYVVGPGDDLAAVVAEAAGDPRAMLTLIDLDDAVIEAPLVEGDRHEALMITHLTPITTPPVTLRVERESGPLRAVVRLYDDQTLAASGQVGLIGADAVMDKIETAEAYRGRGLARQVMADLTATALARGASDGVLIASSMGRGMYEHLGWRVAASVRTFMGAAPTGGPATSGPAHGRGA